MSLAGRGCRRIFSGAGRVRFDLRKAGRPAMTGSQQEKLRREETGRSLLDVDTIASYLAVIGIADERWKLLSLATPLSL
jgi:hypothetical protein